MVYTINHEDIWIESVEPLSWRQMFGNALNYESNLNTSEYMDYRPTQLQFHLSSVITRQNLSVKIKYANRLTRIHAEQAIVCLYDAVKKQWIRVSHTLNTVDRTLEFTSNTVGIFAVFVNHYWYTSFTQRMADEYPNWTKIRQTKSSTGQLFMNYFGMELETIQDYLEWIQEQKYIGTADLQTFDWVYLYQLPSVQMSDTIKLYRIYGSGATETYVEIPVLETLQEFFYNERNHGAILDYQELRVYATKKYGRLRMTVESNGTLTAHVLEPTDFHIWNSFDEFGMLLGVERLHLEKNGSFKERILDVFRYPSGTHDIGMTNGIARELAMIVRKDRFGKDLNWQNDYKDFYLKNVSNKIIDLRTLRVDNQPLQENQYEVNEVGDILIHSQGTGKPRQISLIYGIDKHQLYDRTNESLRKMMFEADGQATRTLMNWVEYINTVAPVMWDRFNWDEGFWDTIDKNLTGLGFIPNIWDSNIDVWKEYTFESER